MRVLLHIRKALETGLGQGRLVPGLHLADLRSAFWLGRVLQWSVLVLGIGLLGPGVVPAQVATNTGAPFHPAAQTPPLPPSPLAVFPPAGKSPIAFFRELLAMPFQERVHSLTNRTPEQRKQILAKLREYETLKPDERELKLKATELRYYLYPLMRAPATNRAALLAQVPETDRKLVEDRLRDWDNLSPEAQKELLDNEAVIRLLSNVPTGTNAVGRPAAADKRVQEWQALPEERRQKLLAQNGLFFNLRPEEQYRVLRTLSEPERRQIEKTLEKFHNLNQAQRSQCIRSFEKFAGLSPAERQQFLKNAERWTLMTPAERQHWRELVNVAPMLPVGTEGAPKIPPPPLPHTSVRGPAVATNGN